MMTTFPRVFRKGCKDWKYKLYHSYNQEESCKESLNSNEITFFDEIVNGYFKNTIVPWRIIPLNASDTMKLSSCTIREVNCSYIYATFGQFHSWCQGEIDSLTLGKLSSLPSYSSKQVSLYCDYKHFHDVFQNEVIFGDWNDVLSQLNLPSIDVYIQNSSSIDCTLWMSSRGAHTPLHYDTYGINIVCQLYGSKRWMLWPPDSFQPLRIPYEESSVYTEYDPKCETSIQPCLDIILEEGDILYIPYHYWHFVESDSTSFSVNMWLPDDRDSLNCFKESITAFLFDSLKQSALQSGVDISDPIFGFENPTIPVSLEDKDSQKSKDYDVLDVMFICYDEYINSIHNCKMDHPIVEKRRRKDDINSSENHKIKLLKAISKQLLNPQFIQQCINDIN